MALQSCVVAYKDQASITHSVEVTAETLYEAAVIDIKALGIPANRVHNISLDIKVRSPERTHSIWGSVLAAWLARPGKSPKEQALKSRLEEMMRD